MQFKLSPPSASLGVQGPPESARIRGLTARMYAIVRNVAVAPASSVVNVLPRSLRSDGVENNSITVGFNHCRGRYMNHTDENI